MYSILLFIIIFFFFVTFPTVVNFICQLFVFLCVYSLHLHAMFIRVYMYMHVCVCHTCVLLHKHLYTVIQIYGLKKLAKIKQRMRKKNES